MKSGAKGAEIFFEHLNRSIFFPPNVWQMMTFLTSEAQGSVSVGFWGSCQLSLFFGGGSGRRALSPPLPPPRKRKPGLPRGGGGCNRPNPNLRRWVRPGGCALDGGLQDGNGCALRVPEPRGGAAGPGPCMRHPQPPPPPSFERWRVRGHGANGAQLLLCMLPFHQTIHVLSAT